MIARLVNDDDVKLPHGFHEAKVTEWELGFSTLGKGEYF